MGLIIGFAVLGLFLLVVYLSYKNALTQKRQRLIDSYAFPERIAGKVRDTYPHLNGDQVAQVVDGLREYFHICNMAGKRMVSMPSQAVDVAWHEFILFTRQYQRFCEKTLGRFLHHVPAEAMSSPTQAQDGIKRAWRLACKRQQIDPKKPTTLPAIFALDESLHIPDGFRYALNCTGREDDHYCASHIGCGGGCGGASCGSDGCGGGCGGD